jgi:archaeosine synthase beta-subunit
MSESGIIGHSVAGSMASYVTDLYDTCGQQKPMSHATPPPDRPHYFLLRTFLGENDLLVILNTKRCQYQCAFCRLPAKSSRTWVVDEDVVRQFRYVAGELRHGLSVVDRLTLSNEGSVLDERTLGPAALLEIVAGIGAMRRVRRIEFETRLEFVQPDVLAELKAAAPRAAIGILTGFETVDKRIRDEVLRKQEPLPMVLAGLDSIACAGAALTAYVLFKPDPHMSDQEAYDEAASTIDYLNRQCSQRGIDLTIRLNPMYRAVGSRWAREAARAPDYAPPKLTDVMRVAEEAAVQGTKIYIGLSAEGLADEDGTYRAREDYSASLIRHVKGFNDRRALKFRWDEIEVDRPPRRARERTLAKEQS